MTDEQTTQLEAVEQSKIKCDGCGKLQTECCCKEPMPNEPTETVQPSQPDLSHIKDRNQRALVEARLKQQQKIADCQKEVNEVLKKHGCEVKVVHQVVIDKKGHIAENV